jgi:hypothetical protein
MNKLVKRESLLQFENYWPTDDLAPSRAAAALALLKKRGEKNVPKFQLRKYLSSSPELK